jgi:hypothetical protein
MASSSDNVATIWFLGSHFGAQVADRAAIDAKVPDLQQPGNLFPAFFFYFLSHMRVTDCTSNK